jgi:hypothetical protein
MLLLLVAGLAAGADSPRTGRHAHPRANPHPDNAVLHAEHMAMLDLARPADATHRAVKDGPWSARSTWKGGTLPTDGAAVHIPEGRTVTVDQVSRVSLHSVRIDGTLRFDPDKDTALKVDTVVVSPDGSLEMGTPDRPIARDKQARLVFADRGPIDTRRDPNLMGRGLISHGTIRLCGAPVTPYAALAQAPRRGDTTLVLARQPGNWKQGDRLLLTGTSLQNQDEELKVLGVSGNRVTVRPLAYDHQAPAAGLSAYVANLSRNVVLASENTADVKRMGHVMFMHSSDIRIGYAAFNDLGRTDKRQRINDPRLDRRGRLIAGSGLNPRGRYAVHFHRTGIKDPANPVRVQGSVVVNSPGWGFVNHSGNVHFENNVAFNVTGAAFVTEAGDEIGTFRRNLAVRSTGSGEAVFERNDLQDFGHEGDGFWFQGGGVTVEDNIAAGQRSTGFIYFTLGLIEDGLGRRAFPVANLPDKSLAAGLRAADSKNRPAGKDAVSVQMVPIRSFKGNIAFASETGVIVRFHLGERCPTRSVLEGGAVWNTRTGVEILYTANVTLRGLRLVGNFREKTSTAVRGGLEGLAGIRYEDLRVEGWEFGIVAPQSGDHVIRGGYYNNGTSILVTTRLQPNRSVDIRDDVRFGTLDAGLLGGRKQYDVALQAGFMGLLPGSAGHRDPNLLFQPDVIRYGDKQLYYLEQAADCVPLKEKVSAAEFKRLGNPTGSVPAELIGKTNQQLWDRYGLAIAGAVAPRDATTEPRIRGLIGRPTTYPEPQRFWHPYTSARLHGFRLVCTGPDKRKVAESAPVDLKKGWNVITLPIRGQRRSPSHALRKMASTTSLPCWPLTYNPLSRVTVRRAASSNCQVQPYRWQWSSFTASCALKMRLQWRISQSMNSLPSSNTV